MYGNETVQRDSKQKIVLRQGSNGNGKTEFQGFSRTFSFFKDSISSQFCITQRLKVHFFSQKRRNLKAQSLSLILIPVIKTGTTAQIESNRIRVAPRSLTCI